ncbi:MAG: DUF2309 domain-containing protein [Bacteroidetes bacterium]|nr:DUF2309 domain-containing protein [Bacteroidota bacterium]
MKPSHSFDEKHLINELKHYLPSQTPLKDFIHHNSLHAFQHMKFYDGIFHASKIFGYQVSLQLQEYRNLYALGRIHEQALDMVILRREAKLNEWKQKLLFESYDDTRDARIGKLRKRWQSEYGIHLDNLVQPLLFRILNSYLDQGISTWTFESHPDGFLAAIKALEKNSLTSFFKSKRVRKLLFQEDLSMQNLLHMIVGDEAYFEQYLFDQQFSHRGWSGMVATIEEQPHTLLSPKKISLKELILFELLLEIDALDQSFTSWNALCSKANFEALDILSPTTITELDKVYMLWQDAFEWSYYNEVLSALSSSAHLVQSPKITHSFQALFCIDERECSLRRHLEHADTHCETYGTPGFFGVEFYFQPEHAKFYDKLCPAPVTPKYLIKETNVPEKRKHELLYTSATHGLLSGFASTLGLGLYAGVRAFKNILLPQMSPAISNAFAHMHQHSTLHIENKDLKDRENDLQIGFTIEEMANRVEGVLRGIGLITNFAPFIYVVAHGSSSANNPHHGAHDCGACSGRPGSVNARVLAFMGNHKQVRELLAQRGISIPHQTTFVGALHDTAADHIAFYDTDFSEANTLQQHQKNVQSFETALDMNAKERSRRFYSINTKGKIKDIRKAILDRSASLFEPRPELGHGTNSLCIVAHRNLTKNLYLDRRAFLNSYDYRTDLEGKYLAGIMKPLGPVCGGINLEYYFSRVDNYTLGAGTKLPHNVMGLIGVANSCDGDLRPGLPLQMIEVHDPVRLLIIVEHFPDIVLKTIQSTPDMYEWFINEWVHLAVFHPETHEIYYFKEGKFSMYKPYDITLPQMQLTEKFFEQSLKMKSNRIEDATFENLPIHLNPIS